VAGDVEGKSSKLTGGPLESKTLFNDITVIPNSVVAKAAITNHRQLFEAHFCTLEVKIDHSILPTGVIEVLSKAALGARRTASGSSPRVYANAFADGSISYQLSFAVSEFSQTATARSDVISRVTVALQRAGISIGSPVTDVRIVPDHSVPAKLNPSATGPGQRLGSATRRSTGSWPQELNRCDGLRLR
jgi:small-conductance mechanosensitive channel